jgi:hypothetical protein
LIERLDQERARMIAEAPVRVEVDSDGRTWLVRTLPTPCKPR